MASSRKGQDGLTSFPSELAIRIMDHENMLERMSEFWQKI